MPFLLQWSIPFFWDYTSDCLVGRGEAVAVSGEEEGGIFFVSNDIEENEWGRFLNKSR
jgi:hypothetical protein